MNPEDSDKSKVNPEDDDSGVLECSDESPPQQETEDLKSQFYNININTKPFLFKKNNEISVYNPKVLLKVYGLNLEISKPSQHGSLDFTLSYKGLAGLAKLNMNYFSLRSISMLLGSLWEASPYILTPLKSPIKLSLHLSHKILNCS